MSQTNVTTFVDKYGDERVIYRSRSSKMTLKRKGVTPVIEISRALGEMVGARIKRARLRQGLSMEQLGIRAGLATSTPKQRIHEIEHGRKGDRREGVSLGTIYAIAFALDVPVCELLPTVDDFRPMLRMETVERVRLVVPEEAQEGEPKKVAVAP